MRPLTVNSIICPLFEILEAFLDVSKKTGKSMEEEQEEPWNRILFI